MLTAVNCGDDTDCTGATIGSIMGIMGGTACIPEDWQAYIGDKIVTVSIDLGTGRHFVPKTCSELAQRVMRLAPVALRKRYSAFVPNAVTVTITFNDARALNIYTQGVKERVNLEGGKIEIELASGEGKFIQILK
jgi:hypothetical protein